MNLVRKLKINNITPITFSQNEQGVIDFVESKIKNLIPFKEKIEKINQFRCVGDTLKDSLYYINTKGECILNCLYCQDDDIIMLVKDKNFWKSLSLTHHLTNPEIEYVLKYFLEKEFKIKFYAITRWVSKTNQQEAEKLYKEYELSKKTED
jgi:hypothetical protein